MPSFGSGEMLGTLKVPNGDGIGKPPPSFKRSGWFGTAWHEEHPPALNVVRPLARLGVCGGSAPDATTAGIVSHQKIAKQVMPAKTTRRRSRRSIHRSVIRRFNPIASMAALSAIGFHEISYVQRHFGNKSGKALF